MLETVLMLGYVSLLASITDPELAQLVYLFLFVCGLRGIDGVGEICL